ncbi:ShlB/FhaC/HecB family hemolysin secretion/activation protein [Rhodoferax sp.]|uniref:ShlB/FhaC/HecB family hemolysin secretion/activation protein n=1 Tax=Rhodoferax sp. TaxID=50421 RepID=UPI0025FA556B|nr:ShlB/FhaC/HecB family hemolysin secretion/activation protein [Rhodoferax sp.]
MKKLLSTTSICLLVASTAYAADIRMEGCIVQGATQLSDEAVRQLIQPHIEDAGPALGCALAAPVLEHSLREAGAFATKVYPMASESGKEIVLKVVEGRLADKGIELGRSSSRVNDAVILGQLQSALQPGSTLRADKYERAILLTNDLPGVSGSENVLYPGAQPGEAKFKSYPYDGKLVDGQIYVDNSGSSYTGKNRLGASINVNSPFGRGERFSLGGNVSDQASTLVFVDASVPLNSTGLRAGMAVDALGYKTDQLSQLRGYSQKLSAYMSYPFVRSRSSNLYSEIRVGREHLNDENNTGTVTDRFVNTFHAKLSGDRIDGLGGGGTSRLSLEGIFGNVDLDGYATYKQDDLDTAQTAGNFSRLVWQASRLQHITGNWQTYVELTGQLASKHMDSSQSMSFGGANNFAGYHSGALLGDKGYRVHWDVRYNAAWAPLGGRQQWSLFYDYGQLTTHAKQYVGNVVVPGVSDESYTLQSAGVGFSQQWQSFELRSAIGWQVNNTIPANLLDGSATMHAWAQMVYKF